MHLILSRLTLLAGLALWPALSAAQALPPQGEQLPPLEAQERHVELFRDLAVEVEDPAGLEPLYEAIGDRRFVLLGESTHGTHEYYTWRDAISRHLIGEKGFHFVGIEGDWEAIYRLNRYVKHLTEEGVTLEDVQRRHDRWPQWMWVNEEFTAFLQWLRAFNEPLAAEERVGVYGLDMQGPHESIEAVVRWFKGNEDEETVAMVRSAYECLGDGRDGLVDYARSLAAGGEPCTEELRRVVDHLRARLAEAPEPKPVWAAKRNAVAVKAAEGQYRGMLTRGPESWNVRARHMHETFLHLAEWHGPASRGIVWAHNTHVGDSSMTQMVDRGEVNIGHLLRESEGRDGVFILGFGSNTGRVIAAFGWGEAMRDMTLVPARPHSVEGLMHRAELKQALMIFGPDSRVRDVVAPFPQRAVGVVYNPPAEAYVETLPTMRYDAFIYFDRTRAVTPVTFDGDAE